MTEQASTPAEQSGRSRDPLANGLRILRWVCEQPEELVGVREVASALGMQPSTVFRLLSRLEEEGLIRQDSETSRYGLGLELLRLGRLATERFDIAGTAEKYMRAIADECQEQVFLGLYDPVSMKMFIASSIASTHPLRYFVELDRWVDVFRAASGLAIMAFLPEKDQEVLLLRAHDARTNDTPWLHRDNLRQTVEQIRARGYACTHGWNTPGAVGVAAPVFAANQGVIGDLVVTIPEVRFTDDMEPEFAELVMRGAAELSQALKGDVQP
jgi:DNA-binding IclR family transcriptional regulator